FGNAVLVADTAALKSGSPDQDRLYSQFSHRLAVLGRQRDSLATRIKNDLFAAAFGSGLPQGAHGEVSECASVIARAEALTGATGS
ncbi:MAG TPA: hypothetical protein VGO87_02085, partial [Acidimicrobiia bacterium]